MEMGLVTLSLDLVSLKLYYGDSDVATELSPDHPPVQASGTIYFSWFKDVPVPSTRSTFRSKGSAEQNITATNLVIGQEIQGSQFVVRAPMECFFTVMIKFRKLDQPGVEDQNLGESSLTGNITDTEAHTMSFYETPAGMNLNLNVQWNR